MQTFTEYADRARVEFKYFVNTQDRCVGFSYQPTQWPIVMNTGERRQVNGKKYAVILCGDFWSDIEKRMFVYLGKWPRKRKKLTVAK